MKFRPKAKPSSNPSQANDARAPLDEQQRLIYVALIMLLNGADRGADKRTVIQAASVALGMYLAGSVEDVAATWEGMGKVVVHTAEMFNADQAARGRGQQPS